MLVLNVTGQIAYSAIGYLSSTGQIDTGQIDTA